MMKNVCSWLGLAGILVVIWLAPSCDMLRQAGGKHPTSLQPGLNFMQPMKWRLTYHYRIQDIQPSEPIYGDVRSAYDPTIPACGKGTYEVWMVPPQECEEVHNVEMTYASHEPTSVVQSEDGEVTFYYFDFAPDGLLPREIQTAVTWEFVTFERYALWDGMEIAEYDTESDFYKTYTADGLYIDRHPEMQQITRQFREKNPDNDWRFALDCYNYIVANFSYNYAETIEILFGGQALLHQASRSWENHYGVCDEFATVFCSMLRSQGIPARPVGGYSHSTPGMRQDPSAEDPGIGQAAASAAQTKYGPFLEQGGHAWAEFYLPDIGWIPVDPTWGQSNRVIDPFMSYMGHTRDIPIVDYYFGKMDPYRIPLYKTWDLLLAPEPITPDAKPTEPWIVCLTERSSGVREYKHGWSNLEALGRTLSQG